MFEFLSSPFGLVAVGLGVLAVAVLALCLWITTLDRRMRGMADGLETERRKVAELQMVIGRRANAARSYGNRGRAAAPAPPRRLLLLPPRPLLLARPCPRGCGSSGADGGIRRRGRAPAGVRAGFRGRPCGRGAPRTWSRPAPAGSGWTPSSIPMRAVGGGRLGAGRTGGAAAHRGARSQDIAQGSSRGGRAFAASAPLPSWRPARLAEPRRPLRPSALSERRRPAPPLLRTPPQPPVLLRAFPPRPRASPRCSPGLRRAFRRPRPPRAGGFPPRASGFPVAQCPSSLKRPAPRCSRRGPSATRLMRWGFYPL